MANGCYVRHCRCNVSVEFQCDQGRDFAYFVHCYVPNAQKNARLLNKYLLSGWLQYYARSFLGISSFHVNNRRAGQTLCSFCAAEEHQVVCTLWPTSPHLGWVKSWRSNVQHSEYNEHPIIHLKGSKILHVSIIKYGMWADGGVNFIMIVISYYVRAFNHHTVHLNLHNVMCQGYLNDAGKMTGRPHC